MARIYLTQRFPLGTRIKKYFRGYRDPFEGLVDHHSDLTNFYHISYDDGDSEEMTEEDVEAHLFSLPKPQRPLKTPKKPKTSKKPKPPKTLKTPKLSKPPKASKPPTPSAMKTDKDEDIVSMSSVEAEVSSPTASEGKRRPTVLSLNANAPGLMCSNSFATSSCSSEATNESPAVSIPANTLEEVEKEEKIEDEEEMKDHRDEEKRGDSSLNSTPEEINLLIGKPVARKVTKEGRSINVVQGTVVSYFPATKMFRVMYIDGECCDLTYQEVSDSIPPNLRPVGVGGKNKRKIEKPAQNEGETSLSAPSLSSKRPKTLDLKTNVTGQTQRSPMTSSLSSGTRQPSSPVIHETEMEAIDNIAFNIVRKVLFIVVSTVKNTAMEAQLEALSAAGLKDKEALEAFVQKDGLSSLAELLSKWEDQVETEQGVLLILKTLAVLPGVTKDVIRDSRIGKKVRGIEKQGFYKDAAIPSLATWVIQKLKADVGVQEVNQKSDKDRVQREEESHLRGSNFQKQSTSDVRSVKDNDRSATAKVKDSLRPQDARLEKEKSSTVLNSGGRSNSASHLLNLMNSRNGRTSRRDRDIFGNVVTVGKLGTPNNWRARRSTVVLDQVSKRLTENAQDVEFVKTKQADDGDWKPSKISFGNVDAVCAFDKDVAVSKLLVFRPPGSTKAPVRPPLKPRSGPLRSILRVRIYPRTASENAPRSSERKTQSAPPTAHLTAKPDVDPVAVPVKRLSLSSRKYRKTE
ncbi:unnamed protein product [Peronospora belbahrii]|uniref:PTM/DIR17-like Tudor domain-containing protein n=1 Tax=Peronospora belbahrii TaxID=622444 RepID=A0AAU9L8W1_9STRA|nr:unnamed protein product [Peronospora belbahrii]